MKSKQKVLRTHNTGLGQWNLDLLNNKLHWSEGVWQLFEITPAQFGATYEAFLNLVHPDDRESVNHAYNESLKNKQVYEIAHRLLMKDGRIKWVNEICHTDYDSQGNPVRSVGIVQDITERRIIEDTQHFLVHSGYRNPEEDFFASLARFLGDTLGVYYVCIDRLSGDRLSAQTVAVYCDGHFEDNLEYTLADTPCGVLLGQPICHFPRNVCALFPGDPALQTLAAESYIGTTLWGFDGKPIGLIALLDRKPMENKHLAEAILKMVSVRAAGELERQQGIATLRQSAETQRVLAEIAQATVLSGSLDELFATIHHLVGQVLPAKNFLINILDSTTQEILVPYRADDITFIPARRPVDKGMTEYIMRLGKAVYITPEEQDRLSAAGEYTLAKVQNMQRMHYLGAPLIDSQGTPFGVMSLFLKEGSHSFQPGDVEVLSIIAAQASMAIERKRAEENSRVSQARYQAIMEQSSEALALIDIETQEVLELNRRFTELLGYSLPEDKPLYVHHFVADTKRNLDEVHNSIIRQQVGLRASARIVRHKNGHEVHVERSVTLINTAGKNYLLASMRDTTIERRRQASLDRDLELARQVQRQLLPELSASHFVIIRKFYYPAKVISGDSYHLEWRNEGKLLRGFLLDVSGHGLGTALQTASIKVLLQETSISQLALRQQLQWVNSRAAKYFTDGAYAAILGFELDLAKRELRYIGAGITCFHANGRKIATPGMFVGLWDDAEFTAGVLPVKEGDGLYFLTDGFTDALSQPENVAFWSPGGKEFDADVAALERLAQSGRLRDDATGICIRVQSLPGKEA